VNHNWYTNADGSPKSHHRPRECEHCRHNPNGGCLLPFRASRKVRLLDKLDNKPVYGFWKVVRNFGNKR
jgi:hypothetical protein